MQPLIRVLALLLLTAPLARAQDVTPRDWTIDKVERKAMVYVPKDAKTTASPLVFVWHGHGGTMNHSVRTFALHKLWPEAIVVYPQGLPTPGMTDPDGKKPGWQKFTGDQGDRDLKFFDAMLESLRKDYKVDDKRIYSTGHSNGGQFTYLLWAARGDTFAAMAPSAAAVRQFRDLKPKPVMHIAGTNDEIVPYPLQKRMMDYVARLNGCEEKGQDWAKSGDLTGILYPSKTATPLVTLISPGTHNYPKEAPELIVKFFKEHQLAK